MIDKEDLRKGAESFGLALDETALDRFDRYAEALAETNKHLNLTAITDPEGIVTKHFLDSLSVLSVYSPKHSARCIDIGTGAGFPGSTLLIARPDLQMTLLDGTQKKLHFVDETLQSMGLYAKILHSRAEEAGQRSEYREQFDLATARAVANLRELSEYCLPFVKVGGTFIAMKSQKTEEEIAEAANAIHLLGGRIDTIHTFSLRDAGERTLILIKKVSQTPPKYPRPSAKIAKQPLK
ncbi:MAG: 16S rRNA (guanine(527)-N(7))-methyltransferase RsmG [Oscillospiraceae bacterium]|nr:16S rRNA (guanine(527)-N(7))-methyltransferase RsmG [Oscillospiraceae bacterium]